MDRNEHHVAAWRLFLSGVLLCAAAVVQAVETAWREVWK